MSRLRITLAASLVLNGLLLATGGAYVAHVGMHAAEVRLGLASDPPIDFTAVAHQRFDGLPGAAVVVFGDSHVQNGPWGELIGESASRGVGGATIRQAASWLSEALYPQTTTLVVELGTNDALQGHTAAQERRDYLTLIAEARKRKASVRLIFVSVPPSRGHRAAAAQVNAALASVCRERHLALVDIGPVVAPSGELTPALTVDGVHLTPNGYALIGPLIRRAVVQAG